MEKDKIKSITNDELFEVFGTVSDINLKKAILTEIIVRKLIPKSADNASFVAGWSALVSQAKNFAENPSNRLQALAELVRSVQAMRMVKHWQERLVEAIGEIFVEPLPPLSCLSDADERLNVARACSLSKARWVGEYVAEAIASEDRSKNTCQELMNCLAGTSGSLSSILNSLAVAFGSVTIETDDKGETITRRIAQCLYAFRAIVIESDLDAGTNIGQAIDGLVASTLKRSGMPNSDKVKTDFAREVLLVLHDIVRTRFSVSTDSNTFQCLSFVRRLFGKWPSSLERELGLLIKDISEALVLLGKQGVMVPDLLEQLNVLCNYPERVKVLMVSLASAHPELPEEIRGWLIDGRIKQRKASRAVEEEVAKGADVAIGFALIDAKKMTLSTNAIKNEILSVIGLYEDSLLSPTKDLLTVCEALSTQVENVAIQRNLGLLGAVGTQVEATLKYFDWIGLPGGKFGYVKKPAIVRIREDGSTGEVVVKGLIDSLI